MKPLIRWAGSKRQLLPTLRKYWNSNFTTYIEPFAGSACLFFDIEPTKAIIGDLNEHLINMYKMVKQEPELVYECFSRLPVGEEQYYEIRSKSMDELTEVEKAAVFIYLNLYCFNGLYRTNSKGQFNVPFGHYKNKRQLELKQLFQVSKALDSTQLINRDFERVINLAGRNDFVYIDPPFWVEKKTIFSEYTSNPFGPDDLERLSILLDTLEARGAKFLVSYADSKEGSDLLKKWRNVKVKTNRYISGKTTSRTSVYELLATNIEEVQYEQVR